MKLTVVDKLLKNKSVKDLEKELLKVVAFDANAYDSVDISIFSHAKQRKNLPKNSILRKGILSIYFKKAIENITGYDLFIAAFESNNNFKEKMIDFIWKRIGDIYYEDLSKFLANDFYKVFKSNQFNQFSVDELIKSLGIILILQNKEINSKNWKNTVVNKFSEISDQLIDNIAKSVEIDSMINHLEIDCYNRVLRCVIQDLLRLR